MVHKISKMSQFINLKLNASIIRQYINKYIQNNDIVYTPKKKDMPIEQEQTMDNKTKQDTLRKQTDNSDHLVSCSNSFVTIARLVELVINDIIDNSLSKCKKNDICLNVLNYDSLIMNITINHNLYKNYYKYINDFNESIDYINILAPYNYIKEYIDLEYPNSLMIDNTSINLLSFIIISIINDILYSMSAIIKFTKKSYFTTEMVIVSCSILFKEPLKTIITTKLEETGKSYKQYKDVMKEQAEQRKKEKNNTQPIEINNDEDIETNEEDTITKITKIDIKN